MLATALMYLRLGVVVAIFNLPLAWRLAAPLAVLAVAAGVLSAACYGLARRSSGGGEAESLTSKNPLELTAALIFALLFVIVSVGSSWVKEQFGHVGIYCLAALVGVTDIDPFVLSVAEGGVAGLDLKALAVAILLAASSNNVLKAVYCVAFAGWRRSLGMAMSLLALSGLGGVLALWLAGCGLAMLPG